MAYALMTFILSVLNQLVFMMPTTFAPAPQGISQYYGFESDYRGPEQTSTIVNIVRTKVYKIEEEDIAWYKNEKSVSKSFYDITLSLKGDSIYIYEYAPNPDNRNWDRRDTGTYLINGTQIFGAHVNYKTAFRTTRVIDAEGKIIEEDERDSLDEIEKIWRKTIYTENQEANEKVESLYYRIDPPRPKYPAMKRGKDSASVAYRDSAKKAHEKAYNEWKEIFKSMKDEYRLFSKTVTKLDSVKRTEDMLFYNYDKGDTLPWGHEVNYYDADHRIIRLEDISHDGSIGLLETTEYQENPKRQLLSKIVVRNGKMTRKETWDYDSNGRCISHTDNDDRNTWKYDSKGNLIEFTESYNGELKYKNHFKIYYQ